MKKKNGREVRLPASMLPKGKAPWMVKCSSVGNPDYGQYAPPAPPMTAESRTLKGCIDAVMEYIETFDLGGGNWIHDWDRATAKVFYKGKYRGYIGYNGKFWDGNALAQKSRKA